MTIPSSNALGAQLMKALGIDPKGVTAIEISLGVYQVPTVTVARLIEDEMARGLADWLGRYELKLKDNSEQIKQSLRSAAAGRPSGRIPLPNGAVFSVGSGTGEETKL